MDRSRVAAVEFFVGLPESDLAAVADMAFEVELASGQSLTTEGGHGHSLFAIEAGTADVVIDNATVQTLGAGDVVGEIAVLAAPPDPFAPPEVAEGGRRTASVIATSPMRLIALFKRDVWTLEQRAPVAAQRLRAKLAERQIALERLALDKQDDPTGPGAHGDAV